MKNTTGEQRKQAVENTIEQHVSGCETLGTAIRWLRLEVIGLDQETFATMCNMSTRAPYLIETDKGNPTLSTLDSILRKFGLRLGLMSTSKSQDMNRSTAANPATQKPFKAVASRGSKPRNLKPVEPALPIPASK